MLKTRDGILVDTSGRQVVLHGINLVNKGVPGTNDGPEFRGGWTREDLVALRAQGLNAVRLGVNWAATEPVRGEYNLHHLAWLDEQLTVLGELGFYVILDAHQDLYSQVWANGAPDWATLTSHPFEATQLWSDAYLTSPAVHESLDAFWANADGIRRSFAGFWQHVVAYLKHHECIVGYDIVNEPTPGAAAPMILGGVLQAFAEATGQEFEQVAADFEDPERKLAQLAHLEDPRIHRAVGDAVAPLVAQFETEVVGPFFDEVAAAIRSVDPNRLILREHNYFSNIGIPAGMAPLQDANWVYSPHGYDLLVDTPAMALASDQRITTIFERAQETAERLGVPVVCGEWGALNGYQGVTRHCQAQLDFFDAHGWSWMYWVFEPELLTSEVFACLKRPRPVAVAGRDLRWGSVEGTWRASWVGDGGVSEFFVPAELHVHVMADGAPVAYQREGDVMRVTVSGACELSV